MSYSAMELAEAFLKTGELDDALAAINQQLEGQPNDDAARRLRIQVQMRLLPQDKLAALLNDFAKLSEHTAEDWQTKSIIQERLGNLADAIAAIQQARRLEVADERLVERLLNLLIADESYDVALALVREQKKTWHWLEREGDVLVLLGNDILATARYGLVLSHLSEFEGTMREDYLQAFKVRVILARAHAYRRLGHTDTAKDHYQSAQAIIADDVTIQFNLGLVAEMDGDHKTALSLCKSALNKASDTLCQSMREALDEDTQFDALKAALEL